jgi:tetratricopeptide (TPR) repeat protein
MPTIVATILAGNSEALIGDAIASAVSWVDRVLLIDTGITDGTRRMAEEIAGPRLIVEEFAWQNDFAAARNFALDAAAACGARWALTLDTDERLAFSGYASGQALQEILDSDERVLSWMVAFRDGSYTKERFIKVLGRHPGEGPTSDGLPDGASRLTWSGRTHECLTGFRQGERAVLRDVVAWEIRKSPEEFRAKLLRDLSILLDETREKPAEPRWWYYLGQTYEGISQFPEALDAYRRCAEIRDGWPEQAAWACFKAASCALELRKHGEALELCVLGLARQTESPELAWLAGFVCYQMGRADQAVTWSQLAVALGHFEGRQAGQHRISFRHLPGWYEGPYDVLRYAYRQLGQQALAAQSETKYLAARQCREEFWRGERPPDLRSGLTGPGNTTISVNQTSREKPLFEPIFVAPSNNPAVDSNATPQTRVAVLGLYSSGSTAAAAMLHHLGVRLGKRFFGNYYEPQWLAAQLRAWWREPELVESSSRQQRVQALAAWITELGRDGAPYIGAKHPLLTLCGPELLEAWGTGTRFVWAWRPLEESIASLQKRGWWPGSEVAVQSRLWVAADEFFASQEHLQIKFCDTLGDPERQVDRLIEFLELRPTDSQRRAAVSAIQRIV